MAEPAEVQARIAALILGDTPDARRLGAITLHAHQSVAVQRLNDAIDRFNGALLCDEVGMGKTYVAIAIARRFELPLVVTPAALVQMWESALAATGIKADTVTFEALSRADADAHRGKDRTPRVYDFVIIDEAHHARNPRTNRYFALETLVRRAKVLLLSATPIHNRREDLIALLSLFLGSRARSMTKSELAQCVVRREQRQLDQAARMPIIRPIKSHDVGDDSALVHALLNLPPPVPARDAGVAAELVGRGLIHQWASSEAALHEALRRRVARATALCVSLEAGTYPTVAELESWIYDDGALQLGFAELLSNPMPAHTELLATVRTNLTALQSIQTRFRSTDIDATRATIVAAIREASGSNRVVAFAQYSETVATLYRRLARTGYVAMLTSHGARVAGGALSRSEAIARFAPKANGSKVPARVEGIELLLTTDLLSEGVNLQDADTVIHLDVPWTAARMEQRVGRVARLGSQHEEVHVHLIRPPASAARILNSEPIVDRKRKIARAEETLPWKVERLREVLRTWRQTSDESPPGNRLEPILATAFADVDGFIAVVSFGNEPTVLISFDGCVSADLDAQARACCSVQDAGGPPDRNEVDAALVAIEHWYNGQRAASAAGVSDSRALRRRDLIARIDSLIESAPPHQRSARLALAAKARSIVTAFHSVAVERELESLLRANLSEQEWLAAIANIDTQQANTPSNCVDESLRIHAVLLLKLRQRQSRSPPDPECP